MQKEVCLHLSSSCTHTQTHSHVITCVCAHRHVDRHTPAPSRMHFQANMHIWIFSVDFWNSSASVLYLFLVGLIVVKTKQETIFCFYSKDAERECNLFLKKVSLNSKENQRQEETEKADTCFHHICGPLDSEGISLKPRPAWSYLSGFPGCLASCSYENIVTLFGVGSSQSILNPWALHLILAKPRGSLAVP
jgi:hypothetical protein